MTSINKLQDSALKAHRPMLGQRYDTPYVVLPINNDNGFKTYSKLKGEFQTNEIQRMLFSRNGLIEEAFLIPLDVTDIVTLMVFSWDNHQEEIIVISATCAYKKYKRQGKILNVVTEDYKTLGEVKSVGKEPVGDTWVKDQHTGEYFIFDKG